MPAFGDTHALTQAQIADLEAYILSVNGVDRTEITNPGIEPKEFFYMLLWITIGHHLASWILLVHDEVA